MKLLEYESKHILTTYDLPIPRAAVIKDATKYPRIQAPVVLKSQVPTGGRGKLGGIVIIENPADIAPALDRLFLQHIKGFLPKTILAEEKIAIKNEYYLSLLVNNATATIELIAHPDGGIEVETNDPASFLRLAIDETTIDDCSRKLEASLGYNRPRISMFLRRLYDACIESDATLIEINPLIVTQNDDLVCGDCKIELDDSARFRHPEWDFEAAVPDSNFVVLNPNGSVATIANGAGLAMATVDAVAAAGMQPANFLDIGGGASTESVLAAFRRIVAFPSVTAIVINIFAGITRCDEVARAIIAAKQQIDNLPPLYIRLAGTNFEEAVALLTAESITTLATLEECIGAAKRSSRE